MNSHEKLMFLRAELKKQDIQAFLIPRGDEHMGEYVAPHSERLAWLTGFTGSAGFAIVTEKKAALFVDGRYSLQVKKEADAALYDFEDLSTPSIIAWIQKNVSPKSKIGFDPWLHTKQEIKTYEENCADLQFHFVSLQKNSIDLIWADQPLPPLAPVKIQDLSHAGVKGGDKREAIAKALQQKNADYAFLTLPDSIAWLLNIRGNDVPHVPISLSFALIDKTGKLCLFIEAQKISADIKKHLGNEVYFAEKTEIEKHFLGLGGKKVLLDKQTAPIWCDTILRESGAQILYGEDPCLLPKAQKNAIELKGIRSAHIRDGAAVTKFLAWVSKAPYSEDVTELSAQDKLLSFRLEDPMFQDSSFNTISGAGPNGAIVHYKSTPETNRPIKPDMIYLVDSGAQYLDGTTDITRTIAIGKPSEIQKRHYTLVLKGHIALGRSKFPIGTTGSQLDAIARYALWQDGLDYNHGTGHGVGCYLSVHEGPQRIAKAYNPIALRPGMVLSNEPGYYKTNEYGIRIENLIAVQETKKTTEFDMLCFETLTFAPFDQNLIDVTLLSPDELNWINEYHQEVRSKLWSLLDEETQIWLENATSPL